MPVQENSFIFSKESNYIQKTTLKNTSIYRIKMQKTKIRSNNKFWNVKIWKKI